MYYNNNFPDNIFARGHRTLTFGTVILCCLLFLLYIIIFPYPALIPYFIAAMILFAGLSVFTIGCNFGNFDIKSQNWIKTILFTTNHLKTAKPISPISGGKE